MKRENWYHDKWYRTRYVWKKNDILIKDINQDMYEKLIHGKWYVWQREIDMINNMKQDIYIRKVEPYLLTWIQYVEKEKVYIMIDNVE